MQRDQAPVHMYCTMMLGSTRAGSVSAKALTGTSPGYNSAEGSGESQILNICFLALHHQKNTLVQAAFNITPAQ